MLILVAAIGFVLASTIVVIGMRARRRVNDADIGAAQKAPISAEPAATPPTPPANPAPVQEPQAAPAEPYDKEAAKATMEGFVPGAHRPSSHRQAGVCRGHSDESVAADTAAHRQGEETRQQPEEQVRAAAEREAKRPAEEVSEPAE